MNVVYVGKFEWSRPLGFGYSDLVETQHDGVIEPLSLLEVLGELARLDVGLLVRDMESEAAVQSLRLVTEQVEAILERAARWRRSTQGRAERLEQAVAAGWARAETAELLGELAELREAMVRVDQALRPVIGLFEEIRRRSKRS